MTAPEVEFPVDGLRDAAPHLRRPFTPQAVKFKVQATWDGGALIVAYIDARLAIERLNLVVPHLWADAYEPTPSGLMWCHLTIDGITRRDVGEGKGKALVSDSLKRAAVHFGVGVSLYAMPQLRVSAKDGHYDAQRKALTPNGETHCRKTYEGWLDTIGRSAFGDSLDHGDADNSAGDLEAADPSEPPPSEPSVTLGLDRVEQIVKGFGALGLTYQQIDSLLGSCGVDPLRAKSKQAVEERVGSLTVEQADALDLEMQRMADGERSQTVG